MSAIHDKTLRVDGAAINRVFSSQGIEARFPNKTISQARKNSVIALASHCIYRVKKKPRESADKVLSQEKNLRIEIAESRARNGLDANVNVKVYIDPYITIVVDSPVERALTLTASQESTGEFRGVLGESYDFSGRKVIELDLQKHYQTLVAALSGHGKTTALQTMLLTMVEATSPDDLMLLLVDLKNEDLPLFKTLPHVPENGYAGTLEEAIVLINWLDEEKEKRKAQPDKSRYGKRILLVVDEAAELDDGKSDSKKGSLRYKLASIMNLGRSLKINTIIATQYPVADTIGRRVVRAFTDRLIGRVDSATTASTIAGIGQTGAEKLGRKGSFIWVTNGMFERVQTYNVLEDVRDAILAKANLKWAGYESTLLSLKTLVEDEDEDEPEDLAQLLEDSGGWREGMQKKELYTILFGDKWSFNSFYKNRADAIVEEWRERFT